jgi:hypothetical protein
MLYLNTSIVRHFQYKLEHLLRMEDRNSMLFSEVVPISIIGLWNM